MSFVVGPNAGDACGFLQVQVSAAGPPVTRLREQSSRFSCVGTPSAMLWVRSGCRDQDIDMVAEGYEPSRLVDWAERYGTMVTMVVVVAAPFAASRPGAIATSTLPL